MTKVTLKCAAVKGVISIYGSPTNPRLFLCEGNSYVPIEVAADTLGEAVDRFMQQIHQLKRTPEAEARAKARGKKIQERILANKVEEAKQSQSTKATNKTDPTTKQGSVK